MATHPMRVSNVERQAGGKRPPSTGAPQIADRVTELLIEHRWATVVPVVLPLSKAYDIYWTAKNIHLRNLLSDPAGHARRVRRIQDQIRAWNAAGRPGRLCTSRKGWQTVSSRVSEYKKTEYAVDVDLHDILEIDPARRVVRVEPRVNMGQLTRALVPLGWTIPVVPELDDLTVGGLYLGYGIESSSHNYGLFADTVLSAEVVLGDGRVVRCSKDENPDIFHALPWSYGAHGFLTAVELPLIECKPYVRVTYRPAGSHAEALDLFRKRVTGDDAPEFVDGLLLEGDRGILVEAEFADLPTGHSANHIGRWYKPWFYKHMESFARRGEAATEYIPLRDYYHRYTRSLYWHGELLVPFANHPLFRYPLGWLMPPKVSFLKLTQTASMRRYREERNVVQDALVPLRYLEEAVEMFHREFECYPLWFVGHKTFRTEPQGMLGPSDPELDEEMYVDLGAWFVPGFVRRGEPWDGRQAVRNMERWLREHHGYQCLYAVTEQTREEFWQMFDPTLHRQVRKKYGAEGVFMDTYDKVKRPEMP